ncbi:MAG: hypothetical protein E7606_01255 [Ruminococcaceae bacterium]|nr:hypothetical protein [Oscillospiraceae bacterium]
MKNEKKLWIVAVFALLFAVLLGIWGAAETETPVSSNVDASFISYQVTKGEGDTFSLRAIAGLDSLNYKNFGYEVTITTGSGIETASGTSTKVYSSVYSGATPYSIKEYFGYKYGAFATINGLALDSAYTELEIRPFVTERSGEVTYGKSATLVYEGDVENGYPVLSCTVATCAHQSVTKTVITAPTCTASGETFVSCNNCEYTKTVVTPRSHQDEPVATALGFSEYTCKLCGEKAMVVGGGETLKLSAFCEGELSFALLGAVANNNLEVLVDGVSMGQAPFSNAGEGALEIESLQRAGHTVEFVNKNYQDVRITTTAMDGYFHRADTVYGDGILYVEMLGKGSLEYSDFCVYVRTNDPSGKYYVCYNFKYQYDTTATNYAPNSGTNISNYRIYGAALVQITNVSESGITATTVENVLGTGEISLAIRQRNPYLDQIPESAKENLQANGQALEHVGGFHGDEWLSAVSLVADDTVIDLKTSEHKVIACSAVLFDQTSTMYAWGTSYEGYRGLPFAEHTQNFAINSTGINHMQTLEWLRGDYSAAGYMPMFTMLRGTYGNRFIDTIRSYDEYGNMLEEYQMTDDRVSTQFSVLQGSNIVAYEYAGDKGITARVDFREANDQVSLSSRIDIRAESQGDNKLYVPFASAKNGLIPAEGEIWMVESHYRIDYVKPNA